MGALKRIPYHSAAETSTETAIPPMPFARSARHEVLGFGDDWFAAASPWTRSAAGDGAAEEDWIPAAWRDEESRG